VSVCGVIPVGGPVEAVAVVPKPGTGPAEASSADEAPGAAARRAEAQALARLEAERAALASARRALESAARAVEALQADIVAAAEGQLVDLALAIARKVLMQDVAEGRYRIEPIVREALRHLTTRRDVTVHLNPQDLAAWQAAASPDEAPPAHLKMAADPGIPRGECVADSAEGAVAVTLQESLQAAADMLRQPE